MHVIDPTKSTEKLNEFLSCYVFYKHNYNVPVSEQIGM